MSPHHVVTFASAVPGAQALAERIAHSPAIQALNQTVWVFSLVEISHLLLMAVLGGAMLALDLRVLGLALPGVAAADVERAARPWLRTGVIGGIVSGTFMSTATALTLAANGAFLIKIVALMAAILFGLALSRAVRAGEDAGKGDAAGAALGAIGLALLLGAFGLFALTSRLDSGAILVGEFATALAILALVRRKSVRNAGEAGLVRLYAAGSILSWIVVAAAGRWIGFS